MGTNADLEARIRRLEARVEIGELIARYGLVMDNRDVLAMGDLFTADVIIESADGVMNIRGREAAVELFRGRFKVLGPSNHVSHDRVLTFYDSNPDEAGGLVLSHAEMNRKGVAMVAAIRYHDTYQRDAGRWRFARRLLTFMYTSVLRQNTVSASPITYERATKDDLHIFYMVVLNYTYANGTT